MNVSIIIPSYNAEKYILTAINSILEQTHQNFELIIIDDGSSDNTKNIIKNIKDSRIVYFYQENKGLPGARNKGIELAKGEYIALLDADDSWHPQKLEKQLNVFKQNKDINIVYTASEEIEEHSNKKSMNRYKNFKTNEDFIKYLLCNMFPICSSIIIKKTVFEEAGVFDETLKPGEDWGLWLRLAPIYNFHYIDEVLVKLFRPSTSQSTTVNIDKTKNTHLSILKRFYNQEKNEKLYGKFKANAFSHQYFLFAIILFYRNKNKPPINEIIKHLIIGFNYSPFYYFSKLNNLRFLARFGIYLLCRI